MKCISEVVQCLSSVTLRCREIGPRDHENGALTLFYKKHIVLRDREGTNLTVSKEANTCTYQWMKSNLYRQFDCVLCPRYFAIVGDIPWNNIQLPFCFDSQKFIGDYPEELFTDEAAKSVISGFQKKLKSISAEIKARNAKLRVPYPYLLPERIPNSIAIWARKKRDHQV